MHCSETDPWPRRTTTPRGVGDADERWLAALDAAVAADAWIRHEAPERCRPRTVDVQRVVKLRREGAQLREARAGDVRKVVVLVVVAHVEREPVERAVIRVRLLARAEHVMLGDVMTGNGMQAH